MNDHHPPPDYSRDTPGSQQTTADPSHPNSGMRPGSAQSGQGPPQHSGIGPPPSQYTTVTMTTDPTPGARVTEINLNIGYYKTLPGILKLAQLVSFSYIC